MSDLVILFDEVNEAPNFATKVKMLSAIAKLYNAPIGVIAEQYNDYMNSDIYKAAN